MSFPDPGDAPPPGADPRERDRWRRDREKFLTEGFRSLPAEPAKIDGTDARLRVLRREHTRFLETHSPVKASLMLALLRPAKEVIHSAEQRRRFIDAQRGLPAGPHIPPEDPGFVILGEMMVAKMLEGDMAAATAIADRVEGKAGLRPGDVTEDDPQKRRQSADIARRVIEELTRDRLAQAGDGAKVIDAEDVEDLTSSKDN